MLRSEIFVHYDGQLILGCVPSYMSYQDSSGALTIGSSLLSYLDMRIPGFLLHKLTSWEARHLGPRIARANSLELVWDGSGDTVFQGRAVHIQVKAPIVEVPIAPNPAEGMVQRRTMGLECWFPGA